jgi:hypothetical protein
MKRWLIPSRYVENFDVFILHFLTWNYGGSPVSNVFGVSPTSRDQGALGQDWLVSAVAVPGRLPLSPRAGLGMNLTVCQRYCGQCSQLSTLGMVS